ncbi:MAG: response regulator [Deltaproteobacteria bacterium]|nr:response regulator [Deltaproteobacteria bacterium]
MRSVIVGKGRAGVWSRVVDQFVPPARWSGDSDGLRRARLLVAVAGFLLVWSTFGALFQHAAGKSWAALVSAMVSIGSAAALVVLRRTHDLGRATAVMAAALFASASVPNLATGGAVLAPMFLLALIAAMTTMVAGRRQGLIWAGLAVAEIVGVQFLPHLASPHFTSGPLTMGRTRLAQPLLAVAIFMGLTLIYERLKRRTLEELEEANAHARQASSARAEFVANVTHELRTPLAGIIGLTDVLLESEPDSDRRAHLQTVRRSADALMHLIGSVLDFSKLEAGRFDIVAEPFAVEQVARDVVRLLGPAADRAGIALRLETAGTLPPMVVGDALRFRQVLLNLVGNGIKFTRVGEVVVRLGGKELPGEMCRLRVEVSDTGPGIPEADVERVFQPFEQIDASSRRRQGGTGLGLPISRRIVALMGAELAVRSEPSRGSTFEFTLELPVHAGRSAAKSSGFYDVVIASSERSAPELYAGSGDPAAAAPTPSHPRRPAYVLVAEDQAINQFLIAHLLEQLGIDSEVVADGAAAVRAAADPGVALVLMDLQMPEVDGISASRAIRALAPPTNALPIVALTASALPDVCAACASVGIEHVLEKPIDRDTLLTVVRELAPALLPPAPPRRRSAVAL